MVKVTLKGVLACLYSGTFYKFTQYFWEVVCKETPIWNWHIRYLCNELQRAAERVFLGLPKEYDIIINIPPGMSKSLITSVMFPAWIWTRMPTARIICASFADDLTLSLSLKCRDIIKSEKYKTLWDHVAIRRDMDTKHHYINTLGGERYACTIGGSVTGFHAHFILVDDPLDPKGARSDAEIKEANLWMTETIQSRVVNAEVTLLVLIMQRLNQNDPTGHLMELDRERYFHICLPASISDDISPKRLKRHYKNGLLDPVRRPQKVLDHYKKTLGAYGYAGQFMQTPIPQEGGMFDANMLWDRIKPLPGKPHLGPVWKKLIRYWDKAGTHNGGCFTVGCLMGEDDEGRFWVIDIVRGQWEAMQREKIIYSTAVADGYDVIVGIEEEGGSGGKESADATLRRLAGFRAYKERATGKKEDRAQELAVQANVGNLYLARAPWNAEYIKELQFFPNSTYKDQVDASSGAGKFAFKTKQLVGGLQSRTKQRGKHAFKGSA